MAHELEVFEILVCKIVKEEFQYKSYGLRKGQFMLKTTKLHQLEKANKLLKHPLTRRFSPLAVQTATPSHIITGALMKGMLIKPPTTIRSP